MKELFQMPINTNNLQVRIDTDMEKLLVESVIKDFKDAEEARNKREYGMDDKGVAYSFDTKLKQLNDMFYGNRRPKTIPWRNCSNRSMKVAMAILEMLVSRLFPAVWNEDLTRWRPTERTDKEKVERITKLMDWWVRVWVKMKVFFHKWVKVTAGYGDSLIETSWERKLLDTGEVIESPVLDEFGQQLLERDGSPAITVDKKFKTYERTRTEIISRERVYFQPGQRSIQDEPVIITCNWKFSQLEKMEQEGKAVNISQPLHPENDTLRKKLEEEITETLQSSNPENIEIIREVKLQNTPVDIIKIYKHMDVDKDGYAEDLRMLVDPLRRIYLGSIEVSSISKRNMRPLEFTKINDLVERPDDLEGYGILEMIRPLAEEIDAIFNQLTDSNTLSVLRPFFYDPGGGLIPQNITLAPNKGIPVPDPARNVLIPDFQIATERLLIAMRAVMEFIERLTGASSYVMGKESEIVGGSGTATRTQAIVSAAEQRFAMPAERLREGAGRILTLLLDKVQTNLPRGFETRVLGEDGQPLFGKNELSDEGISAELDAYILADASMGSMAVERQLAVFLYQLLLGNPIVATDPIKIYNTTARLLKAFKEDPVEHLGPAPKAEDIDTPQDENTLIVQGDFDKVRALVTENHLEHIASHQLLFQSPTLQALQVTSPQFTQEIMQFTQLHIQDHMSKMQQMLGMVGNLGGKNGGQPNQAIGGTQSAPGMELVPEPGRSVDQTQRKGEGGGAASL